MPGVPGEARVELKQLKDFPKQVGAWKQLGGDEKFNQETLAVLRASIIYCAL